MDTLIWISASSSAMSAIAWIGLVTVALNQEQLNKLLLPLVAFSAGIQLGGALLHLLRRPWPESHDAYVEAAYKTNQRLLKKRLENHAAPVALYFVYYNFGRVHQTLRVTPAMNAGLSDHVWSVEDIVGLLGQPD